MSAARIASAMLLAAAILLTACGPRHAQLAHGGPAASPAVTLAPSPSPWPSPPVDTSTPIPTPVIPLPALVPTPRPPTPVPAPPAFSTFPLPDVSNRPGVQTVPSALVAGSDGNLWWVDPNSDVVARTTPRGVTTVFRLPGGAQPSPELVAAPDGTLWSSDYPAGKLLHITMAGAMTDVALPTPSQSNPPTHLTVAPDGALWYQLGTTFYRRDTAGSTMSHPVPQGTNPVSLTVGPDSALWFGETVTGGQGIARLDPGTGTVQHYAVPGPPTFVGPLLVAPDGTMWFGEDSRGKVGRITLQGAVTEFALPTYAGRQLTVGSRLVLGHDGALWAATGMELVRLTLAGAVQIVPVTGAWGAGAHLYNLAEGPDGHLWMLMGSGSPGSGGLFALVRDNRA